MFPIIYHKKIMPISVLVFPLMLSDLCETQLRSIKSKKRTRLSVEFDRIKVSKKLMWAGYAINLELYTKQLLGHWSYTLTFPVPFAS